MCRADTLLVARTLTLLLFVHPFLYHVPRADGQWWAAIARLFTSPANLSGVVAWVALLIVVFAAILRDRLPISYEVWRASHGVGALLVAGAGVHHAFSIGHYTPAPIIGVLWLILFAVAVVSLLTVYVIRPIALRTPPFRVVGNRQIGEGLWELTVEPDASFESSFEAGQFYWVTIGASPFSLREHPFSASSAPEELPSIRFLIQEAGDFTDTIGSVPPGTTTYLDGPYGIFTTDGRDAPGLAFVAGGVGIAPVLSILRHLRAHDDSKPVRLLYGARDLDHAVYLDELEQMQEEEQLDFRFELVLSSPPTGWTGPTGVLDATHLEAFFDETGFQRWSYFICGPTIMMRAVGLALGDMGVPGRHIVSERFRFD
ncbi:MAG: ferric reductase-like transmembrane domain-containing protein [Persicimonas sp.]